MSLDGSQAKRRRHVTRACEQCRSRKRRCSALTSGEQPACSNCIAANKTCTYSDEVDGRSIPSRYAHVRASTSADASSSDDDGSDEHHVSPTLLEGRGEYNNPSAVNVDGDDDPARQPFETGLLVLSATGNLHLHPSATFYRPAHVGSSETTPDPTGAPLPGYLARYLPFPLAREHHQMLLDLFFDTLAAFGCNFYKTRFMAAMERDPHAAGIWFSPLLHLVALAVGWRYCRDRALAAAYHDCLPYEKRGYPYMDRAKQLLMEEVADPQLSTIKALPLMSLYHVGILQDSVARSCLAMAMYHAQDFRLFRRCDEQLVELGLDVDSELDIARRDVYGYIENYNCWWSTYFGQQTLPLRQTANQRMPYVYKELVDLDHRAISCTASHHVQLSYLGMRALHCNHGTKSSMRRRVMMVREIDKALLVWRETLPQVLRWPPTYTGRLMHTSTIATHGMYNAHVLLLFRPYIIEIGNVRYGLPEASGRCLAAAQEIVELCRYIRGNGRMQGAPLSFQHILYVCGTMLVLQTSGLASVSDAQLAEASTSLRYVQEALDEFAEIWPVAGQTARSLRKLAEECSPTSSTVLAGEPVMLDNAAFLSLFSDEILDDLLDTAGGGFT